MLIYQNGLERGQPVKPWAKQFYGSKQWRTCQAAHMGLKNRLCERCDQKGEIVPAKIVHHKTHLTPENINDPTITLNHDNLEALCQNCHNQEHHSGERVERYRWDSEGNAVPI